LGAAEAGVFPGIIYYFSFWYKPEERALRIAAFLSSASLAGAFGGYGLCFRSSFFFVELILLHADFVN
jgi:hypothetical protein